VHPYLLHSGHLYLPTFGVLAAIGLVGAILLSQRTAKILHLDPDRLWDAGLFAILAAFVSSRALLIVQHFNSFRTYPVVFLAVPSLTASGLLLTIVSTVLWLRWKRLPILTACDAWAPCATLVWAFLALGHFMEGSDPGMPTHHGPTFPGDPGPMHPVALYTCAAASLLTVALYRRLRRTRAKGETLGFALIGSGVAQFLISFLRQPGLESQSGLDLLQWVALSMMVVGGMLLVFAIPETIVRP